MGQSLETGEAFVPALLLCQGGLAKKGRGQCPPLPAAQGLLPLWQYGCLTMAWGGGGSTCSHGYGLYRLAGPCRASNQIGLLSHSALEKLFIEGPSFSSAYDREMSGERDPHAQPLAVSTTHAPGCFSSLLLANPSEGPAKWEHGALE